MKKAFTMDTQITRTFTADCSLSPGALLNPVAKHKI